MGKQSKKTRHKRTLIEVADGAEVQGRRSKMIVRTGHVATEGLTIWATAPDAARLRVVLQEAGEL